MGLGTLILILVASVAYIYSLRRVVLFVFFKKSIDFGVYIVTILVTVVISAILLGIFFNYLDTIRL